MTAPRIRLPVVHRRRNGFLHYASILAIVSGVAAFAAVIANPMWAVVGFYAALTGLCVQLMVARMNYLPRRAPADASVTEDGILLDDRLAVRHAAIDDVTFDPATKAAGAGDGSTIAPTIRVLGRRRRVLLELEVQSERDAKNLLSAMGMDPANMRTRYATYSPAVATTGRTLLSFAVMLVVFTITMAIGLWPLSFVAALLFGLMFLPRQVVVGADGVLTRWLGMKRFIPMSELREVRAEGDRDLVLVDRRGREHVIHAAKQKPFGESPQPTRDAIQERVEQARAAATTRGRAAEISGLVARGPRSHAEWLAALKQLLGREGSYRDASVREEDLWALLEDPTAKPDVRAGAAMGLRKTLDDEGRTRVRVAASATVSPHLRVALDSATRDDDATLEAALAEVADEESAQAKMDRR
jgi:hypothetical protein